MSAEKKVPEIRFKGFSEDWREVTLSSVIDVRSGKDYKHLGKGNIPVYGTGGYMLSVNSALSNDEDAIGVGRKGTIDKPYILRAPFWTVDTLFYAVPSSSFKLDFLFCLFQKIDWKKHDESTGVPSLSKVAINNIPVYVTNDKEQTAIGNTFQKLDSLISQHQQKHDQLSNIKKAMLEKIFPKQGETTPEIRFKGFSGDWEEKELREICTYHSSSLTVNDAATNGVYPLYDANKCIGYTDKNIQDTDYITIIKDGSGVGRIRVLPKNSSFIATMGAMKIEKSDLHFLYCCLLRIDFSKHISGATIPHVYFRDYGSENCRVPIFEEQTAIGNYFQKLDTLISKHQNQITKLNNIKQACLSKMFV